MKKVIFSLILLSSFLLILLYPTNALAQRGVGSCTIDEIDTAIGCIPVLNEATGQEDFIIYVVRWSMGIAGGIAFLLILLAGFQIMTSQGNPERLKAGQELLTSAIAGLILLIFSVFILEFIGVRILGLPIGT